MSRYQAAAIHFAISFLVFIPVAYLVLERWYPDYFFTIDGGWEGMRIVIGVNLALGPLLTLIVFKHGKPGLKFDLTLIGLVQGICLLAGLYIVYANRPLFFVYYEGHFYSCSARTFERYNRPLPDPSRYSTGTPAKVSVELPDSPIEEADLRRLLYHDEIPLWLYEPLFVPLDKSLMVIVRHGFDISRIIAGDPGNRLDAWVEEHGGIVDDYAFFPLHSRYREGFIGIRKATGEVVGLLGVVPPKS